MMKTKKILNHFELPRVKVLAEWNMQREREGERKRVSEYENKTYRKQREPEYIEQCETDTKKISLANCALHPID